MPRIVYEPLMNSKFTTISHLLVRQYLSCNEWINGLINEYIPNHRQELSQVDVLNKKPIDWLADFSTDDEKNIFRESS